MGRWERLDVIKAIVEDFLEPQSLFSILTKDGVAPFDYCSRHINNATTTANGIPLTRSIGLKKVVEEEEMGNRYLQLAYFDYY